jgi:16S rRNA (uracil1498-N3)-methyltransferase
MDKPELYYVRPQDVSGEYLSLKKDEFHHLVHVCRKRQGDTFLAADGQANVYECQIEFLERDGLQARIIKKRKFMGEPLFQLTLALAVPKKERFEWVIEKATEIGVNKLIPLMSDRTIAHAKSLNYQRCGRIALAAMKQCQRSLLPIVEPMQDFRAVCENAVSGLKLLAHEKAPQTRLEDIFKNPGIEQAKSGVVCIGPEGGFTEEEVAFALAHGFTIFGLGPRRLRSETAALVAAALVLDKMGELS